MQLPIFNEQYVVDRLLGGDLAGSTYPREKLDVQLLDDSTDETIAVAGQTGRAECKLKGFPITSITIARTAKASQGGRPGARE